MSWETELYTGLKESGIRLICYVPDIVLADLIKMIESDEAFKTVPLTREEEGVGVLSGAYMGGLKGALLLQSSGLGNSINALTSLCIPQQIPFLMVMSPRGDLGEPNPFQVPMGKALEPILDALSIHFLPVRREDEVKPAVDRATKTCFRANYPVALILTRELTGGKDE